MKLKGYRVFKLKKAIMTNEHPEDSDHFGAFVLMPVVSNSVWAKPDGTFSRQKTAEMISTEAMKRDPNAEYVVLPVFSGADDQT